MTTAHQQFVICIRNDAYAASLERRKVYRTLPDDDAERRGLLRVVDESGDDYLYPRDLFVAVELSKEAQSAVLGG